MSAKKKSVSSTREFTFRVVAHGATDDAAKRALLSLLFLLRDTADAGIAGLRRDGVAPLKRINDK